MDTVKLYLVYFVTVGLMAVPVILHERFSKTSSPPGWAVMAQFLWCIAVMVMASMFFGVSVNPDVIP